MIISLFSCPFCGHPMEYDEHVYRCMESHYFDIAKEGYVNLLPVNRRHSGNPGDDREMVSARTRFLSRGWYEPLRRELCNYVEKYMPENGILIDAGCGEGYYTESLSTVAHRVGGITGGLDLSKAAVRKAAKRCHCAEIAVASVYHMPLADQSVDLIACCFAPLAVGEYYRILKSGGTFLYVIPGRKHLWEMKEILYEHPYENDYRTEDYKGFHLIEESNLEFRCDLTSSEDISALFHMTPYSWKTHKNGVERLLRYKSLDIQAQFRILVYKRDT